MGNLAKEIKTLKGYMISQSDLRPVTVLKYGIKIVVNKALAIKKLLQGESQRQSDGESPKKVEKVRLTTLVLCDGGYLG